MKTGIYFLLALIVTLALFSFMRYLITNDQDVPEATEIAAVVEIFREPPKQDKPEPEPEVEPEPIDEPQMDTLSVSTPQPSAQIDQPMPSVSMGDIALNVGPVGDSWAVPIAGADKLLKQLEGGEDNQGYIEIIPYSTGQPNIPEVAWQNKINGWVLVVFTVTREGRTDKVRILDANPKGVFEEEVVKAVSGWRYAVGSLKNYRGDMVLTQKIELFWKDYPNNRPTY